jgi:hypothetical protein
MLCVSLSVLLYSHKLHAFAAALLAANASCVIQRIRIISSPAAIDSANASVNRQCMYYSCAVHLLLCE